MGAFTRGTILALASLVVFSVLSFAASAQPADGPQFRPVTATHLGAVTVRELPALQAGSQASGTRPFYHVGTPNRSGPGSAVPVVTLPPETSAATAAAEQVVTGFTGMTLSQQVAALGNDQAVTPPDPQIAAGPNDLLEMVNSSGSVWTKTGTRTAIFDLNIFFKLPMGYTFSDPRVLYDAISGRWFADGVGFTQALGSRLLFGVSDTDDPAGAWHIFFAGDSANVLHDQPKIGVSTDKVAISFNDFLNGALFLGQSTFVFSKAAMLAGASSIPGGAIGPDSTRASIVPATQLTATSTEYMTYNNSDCANGCNRGFPTVGVVAITGDPALGTLAWNESDPAIAGTSNPPMADQNGVPASIDTNDDRFLTTVWENGNLWTVGNDACTPPGDLVARPCPRLIQVSTDSMTVNQNFDLGRTGTDFFFPAVHLDSAGNMYLVYNISSLSDYVGVRITGQPAGSPPQVVSTPQTIKPGDGLYTCFARWGDYSGAALDPATPSDVWVAGEYAGASSNNCEWATFVARLTFGTAPPPPPTAPVINSISPTSGPAAGGTTVSILGSGLSASGAATTASFGTNQVTASCGSATSCTAVSPAGVGGKVNVTVTVNAQTSNAVSFTYIPRLSTISPTSGPPGGGTTVTITGTGFSTVAGQTTFAFGTKAATGVNCSSTTTCTAVTPPGGRGTTVHVTVKVNGVAGANSLSFFYRRR